jgi:hypothetical protein
MNWLEQARKTDPLFQAKLELPERFRSASLAGIEQADVAGVVAAYAKVFSKVAVQGIAPLFLGRARTWKSYGSAALVRHLWQRERIDVGWCCCASELPRLDRLRTDRDTTKRIEWLCRVPFLVMDDFNLVRPDSWAALILQEIGVRRFDGLRPTLYTGNAVISKDDNSAIEKAYGPALARRIVDGSEGFRLVIK